MSKPRPVSHRKHMVPVDDTSSMSLPLIHVFLAVLACAHDERVYVCMHMSFYARLVYTFNPLHMFCLSLPMSFFSPQAI